MNNDLLQVARTAESISEYLRRYGGGPTWCRDNLLILEANAKLLLDHIRVANGGKLPSEIQQQETLATGR